MFRILVKRTDIVFLHNIKQPAFVLQAQSFLRPKLIYRYHKFNWGLATHVLNNKHISILCIYLNIRAFSNHIQPTINPFIYTPNHHSTRPTAAESRDIKAHNCIGSWFTFIHILSLQMYLNGYLMLSTHIFLGLRAGTISRAIFTKKNFQSVFSHIATYPANRSFLHFTITQLEIEYKKSATEICWR